MSSSFMFTLYIRIPPAPHFVYLSFVEGEWKKKQARRNMVAQNLLSIGLCQLFFAGFLCLLHTRWAKKSEAQILLEGRVTN